MCKAKPGLRCASSTRRRLEQATTKLAHAQEDFAAGSLSEEDLADARYEQVAAYVADSLSQQGRHDPDQWTNDLKAMRKLRADLVNEANRLEALGHTETLDYSPAFLLTSERYREQADVYASAVAVRDAKENIDPQMREKAARVAARAEQAMTAAQRQAEDMIAQAQVMRADGESRVSSIPRPTSPSVQDALDNPDGYWQDSPHDRSMSVSHQGRVVYVKDGPIAYGLDTVSEDEAQALQDGIHGAGAGASDDTTALRRLTAANVAVPFRAAPMHKIMQRDIANALELRTQAQAEGKRNTVAAYTHQLKALASRADAASSTGDDQWGKVASLIRHGLRSSKPRPAVR